MSYDAWIGIDTGSGKLHCVEEIGNMTSNVGRFYGVAMPGPFESGGLYDGERGADAGFMPRGGLPGLSGLRCDGVASILHSAIQDMMRRPSAYQDLAPNNDWGTYEQALGYLAMCRDACMRHPLATFCLNW